MAASSSEEEEASRLPVQPGGLPCPKRQLASHAGLHCRVWTAHRV